MKILTIICIVCLQACATPDCHPSEKQQGYEHEVVYYCPGTPVVAGVRG